MDQPTRMKLTEINSFMGKMLPSSKSQDNVTCISTWKYKQPPEFDEKVRIANERLFGRRDELSPTISTNQTFSHLNVNI